MPYGDDAKGVAPVRRKSRRPRSFYFGLGDALARSFSCFGKHFPVLCLFGFALFLPLVLYHDLRHAKEGVWLDELMRVFD